MFAQNFESKPEVCVSYGNFILLAGGVLLRIVNNTNIPSGFNHEFTFSTVALVNLKKNLINSDF